MNVPSLGKFGKYKDKHHYSMYIKDTNQIRKKFTYNIANQTYMFYGKPYFGSNISIRIAIMMVDQPFNILGSHR